MLIRSGTNNKAKCARQKEIFSGVAEKTYPYYQIVPYISYCGVKTPEMFNIEEVTLDNGIEFVGLFMDFLERKDAEKVLNLLEENQDLKDQLKQSEDL